MCLLFFFLLLREKKLITMSELTGKSRPVNPNVSVDCVIIGYDGEQLSILLVSQKDHEEKNASCAMKLPGSLIYNDEDLDEAAQRVLHELTGLTNVAMFQFHAFGSKDRTRNPKDVNWLTRFHQLASDVERIVTVGYFSMLKIHSRLEPLSPRYEACWVPWKEVGELAFDHNEIITCAVKYVREYVESNPIVLFNLLPRKFTASELRHLYEVVYDRSYDVRNFHKKISMMDYVLPLEERQSGVAHRAARYYRFDKVKYNRSFRKIN